MLKFSGAKTIGLGNHWSYNSDIKILAAPNPVA